MSLAKVTFPLLDFLHLPSRRFVISSFIHFRFSQRQKDKHE